MSSKNPMGDRRDVYTCLRHTFSKLATVKNNTHIICKCKISISHFLVLWAVNMCICKECQCQKTGKLHFSQTLHLKFKGYSEVMLNIKFKLSSVKTVRQGPMPKQMSLSSTKEYNAAAYLPIGTCRQREDT